jgi:hypothetical protein
MRYPHYSPYFPGKAAQRVAEDGADARRIIAWRQHYNAGRTHSVLGYP